MPHEGIPDPSHHKICRRCRSWFEPEGSLVGPQFYGPFAMLRHLRIIVRGDKELRFQCRRCTRVRRITQIVIWSLLLAAVGVVLVLERLGVLAH
jgi:hypothetical protein